MADFAMPQLQELILSAVPAYETYLLQVMGKSFALKMPVLKPNPDQLTFTFESIVTPEQGLKTPQRVVMKVEYLRSMKMATLRLEWWPDINAEEPKAVNEPSLADSIDNLLSPHFVFGWLKKMVGGWAEGVESKDMPEARMEYAERLIVKADELLAGMGYVIEANDYESYANTLDQFLLSTRLDEQTEGILSKVGDVVRKAAHAYGAAKGAVHGAKARWKDFKASVKGAFSAGHEKGFKKTAGRGPTDADKEPEKKKSAIVPVKPIAATAPTKLKSIKGGKAKRERYPGGKMADTEYKARYKKSRASGESLEQAMDDLVFEGEFNNLDEPELVALEALVGLMAEGELTEGTKFKALVGKLKSRGGVRNPAALAAWIGRKKYGAEKFAKMSQEGRKRRAEAAIETPAEPKTGQVVGTVVGDFRRLAGVVSGTGSWKVP